jgi:diadenosine tetraphosphate (Ap4A) HIT family hydrolase
MVCVLGRRMSPPGTVRMNNMVNRGMRFISPVVLMGLAGFMCAEVASQSLQAVFKPDYQSRCPCDHSIAETLLAYPQCSLCLESEFHPPHVPFFFIQDINPTKPNRWLILPRAHDKGMQNLSELPADVGREFWAAAIRKAEELWGKQWGLAVNGELARSQCHAHVHIGKLLDGVEGNEFLFKAGLSRVPGKAPVTVAGPERIKAPEKGASFWVHPVGKKLHLHVEDITAAAEYVLMR